jgi:bifunctional ADP-heptose synthase (sugar kinase/adenylyltransferase)
MMVSLGRAGVMLMTRDEQHRIHAPTVKIHSKIGAGDSTVAGAILALQRGESLLNAARFGVAYRNIDSRRSLAFSAITSNSNKSKSTFAISDRSSRRIKSSKRQPSGFKADARLTGDTRASATMRIVSLRLMIMC